jgi:hypothetical protein
MMANEQACLSTSKGSITFFDLRSKNIKEAHLNQMSR